jgi:hypothetical protein
MFRHNCLRIIHPDQAQLAITQRLRRSGFEARNQDFAGANKYSRKPARQRVKVFCAREAEGPREAVVVAAHHEAAYVVEAVFSHPLASAHSVCRPVVVVELAESAGHLFSQAPVLWPRARQAAKPRALSQPVSLLPPAVRESPEWKPAQA